jgi:hypothetical protein
MNVKKVILCLILIIIIIIAAYCNTQIVREGYFDTSMPSLDMIKKVPLAPDSNITNILAKMYAIVKDNEDFLTNTYNNMRRFIQPRLRKYFEIQQQITYFIEKMLPYEYCKSLELFNAKYL